MIERKRGFSECLIQIGHRHAPWFAYCGISSRQRQRAEVPCAPVAIVATHQKFSPPDRAVGSITGAVEYDPDGVAIQAVLCHAGSKMGMVVLYPGQRDSGILGETG